MTNEMSETEKKIRQTLNDLVYDYNANNKAFSGTGIEFVRAGYLAGNTREKELLKRIDFLNKIKLNRDELVQMTIEKQNEIISLTVESVGKEKQIEELKEIMCRAQDAGLEAYIKYNEIKKALDVAKNVLEMVQDNSKMPHTHNDPQLRLYCLTERSKEAIEKINGIVGGEK